MACNVEPGAYGLPPLPVNQRSIGEKGAVNRLLERLGGFAARRHWIIIIAWLVILAGLFGLRYTFGGEFVNNYTVSGSDSATGLDVLRGTYPQQGGYRARSSFTRAPARSAPSSRP